MSRLLLIMVIVLFVWYERELLWIALSPIIDIIVCIIFILAVFIVLVCEIALIVIAPIAYSLGYDSEKWHVAIARKMMMFNVGKKKDES